MNKDQRNNHQFRHHLVTLSLFTAISVPSAGAAMTVDDEGSKSIAADADPCEESTIALEIDVLNGNVYYEDPVHGLVLLTNNQLDVHFGSLGYVLVELTYTSSEWEVDIAPDNDPVMTYRTNNGGLRYSITDSVGQYVFSSSELTQASTTSMMNMTPTIPDIIILTHEDCPPPV